MRPDQLAALSRPNEVAPAPSSGGLGAPAGGSGPRSGWLRRRLRWEVPQRPEALTVEYRPRAANGVPAHANRQHWLAWPEPVQPQRQVTVGWLRRFWGRQQVMEVPSMTPGPGGPGAVLWNTRDDWTFAGPPPRRVARLWQPGVASWATLTQWSVPASGWQSLVVPPVGPWVDATRGRRATSLRNTYQGVGRASTGNVRIPALFTPRSVV